MLQLFLLVIAAVLKVQCDNDNKVSYCDQLIKKYIAQEKDYKYPKDNFNDFGTTNENVSDYGVYDFIIIGAGSAGSVIANRLSEESKWKILLLEAGDEPNDLSVIPGVYAYLTATEMNWGYLTTPQKNCCLGMRNKQCAYPRGKALGGSGSINGLIYSRGNKKDYDHWEKLGNPGWNYSSVLPYFKKSERSTIYINQYHGNNGSLNVEYPEPASPLFETFSDGLSELGEHSIDYNGAEEIGFSQLQMTTNNGRRVSGFTAYIKPAMKRENLEISTKSLVSRILTEKSHIIRAKGVEFIRDRQIFKAYANIEVILSAGTMNSPQILQLSGIGPKQDLEKLNITVVKNLPAVGRHLKDHPLTLITMFKTNVSLKCPDTKSLVEDFLNGEGILTSAGGMYGIWYDQLKQNKRGVPDVEYTLVPPYCFNTSPDSLLNPGELVKYFMSQGNPRNQIFVFTSILHPKSIGRVTLKSNKPQDFPNINLNYFSDHNDEDLNTMYLALQKLLNLTNTEPFKKIGTTMFMPVGKCKEHAPKTESYWKCWILELSGTMYHATGTTRMGPSEESSVVDSRLKVYGVDGLRVADAGIIPVTLSGHTNAPAIMIGERAADFIKEEYLEYPTL